MSDYNQKTKAIDEYIAKLDKAISSSDINEAAALQKEIIAVYSSEIDYLTSQLTNYSLDFFETAVDFIGDAKILKAKLINYKNNIVSGYQKMLKENNSDITLTQNINQNSSINVSITLESTVSLITNIPSSVLSNEEKELLIGKLTTISTEKDKNNRWDKIKNTLKWILDKGIEVGTVALPYITSLLGN